MSSKGGKRRNPCRTSHETKEAQDNYERPQDKKWCGARGHDHLAMRELSCSVQNR